MAKINDVEYGEWKAADVRVKVNTSLVLDLPTSLKFDYLVSNLKMKDIPKEHRHMLAHISKRELSRYFVKVGIEKLFEELFQGKLNPPEEDSQQSSDQHQLPPDPRSRNCPRYTRKPACPSGTASNW